jgi:hypothetical protein
MTDDTPRLAQTQVLDFQALELRAINFVREWGGDPVSTATMVAAFAALEIEAALAPGNAEAVEAMPVAWITPDALEHLIKRGGTATVNGTAGLWVKEIALYAAPLPEGDGG